MRRPRWFATVTRPRSRSIANDSVFGLAAGIWSRDYRRAWRLAVALQAGTVWIDQALREPVVAGLRAEEVTATQDDAADSVVGGGLQATFQGFPDGAEGRVRMLWSLFGKQGKAIRSEVVDGTGQQDGGAAGTGCGDAVFDRSGLSAPTRRH